mmetsp:Transcript_24188/g.36260  ORF Transcript_24188/g.36260 Transcript_24188/m.36260 type:complete len:681 (-) Transcript_24188:206-2248(-)
MFKVKEAQRKLDEIEQQIKNAEADKLRIEAELEKVMTTLSRLASEKKKAESDLKAVKSSETKHMRPPPIKKRTGKSPPPKPSLIQSSCESIPPPRPLSKLNTSGSSLRTFLTTSNDSLSFKPPPRPKSRQWASKSSEAPREYFNSKTSSLVSLDSSGSRPPKPPCRPNVPKPTSPPALRPRPRGYHTMGAKSLQSKDFHSQNNGGKYKTSPAFGHKLDENQEKMKRNRDRVCTEIKTTESAFVENLETLNTHYILPLKDRRSPMKAEDSKILFNNIDDILMFHKLLLSQLKGSTNDTIHKPFVNINRLLSIYTTYVNGYNAALDVARDYERNSRFQRFLEKAMKESDKNLGLMAYLIMPVQRIPRYVLLLKEVIKNTPPEKKDIQESLQKSLTKVENVAQEINERKRRLDNQLMALAIRAKLGKSIPFDLFHKDREFVFEGQCKELKLNSRHVKDRVVVIFSDMILWATFPAYKYKGHRSMKTLIHQRVGIPDPISDKKGAKVVQGLRLSNKGDQSATMFFFDDVKRADDMAGYIAEIVQKKKLKSVSSMSRNSTLPLPQQVFVEEEKFSPAASQTNTPTAEQKKHHQRIRSMWGGTQLGLISASIASGALRGSPRSAFSPRSDGSHSPPARRGRSQPPRRPNSPRTGGHSPPARTSPSSRKGLRPPPFGKAKHSRKSRM